MKVNAGVLRPRSALQKLEAGAPGEARASCSPAPGPGGAGTAWLLPRLRGAGAAPGSALVLGEALSDLAGAPRRTLYCDFANKDLFLFTLFAASPERFCLFLFHLLLLNEDLKARLVESIAFPLISAGRRRDYWWLF